MKKITLLIFSCILATMFASCVKDDVKKVIITSDDDKLAGEKVSVGENENVNPYYKLFVLNEGAFMANNSSLDFLRFTDNTYVRDAFSKMNPSITMGLGDTGNDLQVYGNSLWAVINGSGFVEVMSAYDEKHLATIPLPQPRNIAFYDSYAYVTSYATSEGAEEATGTLYKISLNTLKKVDSLSIGYNPEGITVCKNRIFVANGGGNHKFDPRYNVYDNRISVIDPSTFKVTAEISSVDNICKMTNDGTNIWVSNMYDSSSSHAFTSGIHCYNANTLKEVELPQAIKDVHISSMVGYPSLNRIFAIGADDESMWPGVGFNLYIIDTEKKEVGKIPFEGTAAESLTYPYGLEVNVFTGDIYIGNASMTFVDAGTVSGFTSDLKKKTWEVVAGVGPAHFALYSPIYY